MVVVFGGGDIANKGIKPLIDCVVLTKQQCDVTQPNEIKEVMELYRPDVVINCAGISSIDTVKDGSIKDFLDEIETNLIGSYYIAKFATIYSVDKMIFISSVAGLYGKPNHSGYSVSKAGVRTLVQSLGMEGHNAYAISPGRVDTKMREKDYPQDKPGTRLNPLEVGGVVEDIISGVYEPGDNILIRRIGYETAPIKVDKGEPWRKELKVGEPVTL